MHRVCLHRPNPHIQLLTQTYLRTLAEYNNAVAYMRRVHVHIEQGGDRTQAEPDIVPCTPPHTVQSRQRDRNNAGRFVHRGQQARAGVHEYTIVDSQVNTLLRVPIV